MGEIGGLNGCDPSSEVVLKIFRQVLFDGFGAFYVCAETKRGAFRFGFGAADEGNGYGGC